jgi:hypothetical protein
MHGMNAKGFVAGQGGTAGGSIELVSRPPVTRRSVRHEKTEAEVNGRLQQVVPPDIAILVDWKGDLVRAYHLPDADVSITILDAKGRACGTVAGPVTRETLDLVRQRFLRARTAGTCQ